MVDVVDASSIVLSHRLTPLNTPPLEKMSHMHFQLQEIIIVGNSSEQVCYIIMLLIKLSCIGPVTGPWLAVLDRGRRLRSNTADRGPVTGPIRNNLINEIFIN